MQQGRDFVAVGHVNGSMVHLDQHSKAPLRQVKKAVQAFHDVHLPQGALQVQRPGVDTRYLDTELPPVARFGQRNVAHVVVDVKGLVFDPVGVVQIEWHT